VGEVRKVLPSELKQGGWISCASEKLHMVQPLDIQAKLTGKQMGSYKAPWNQESCQRAVDTTSMYEAGANVLWLDPGLGRSARVAHEQPSVQTVQTVMASYFSKESMWSPKAASRDRLVWPIAMEAYVLVKAEIFKDYFDHSIALLAGHAMLFAWYGAMFNALVKRDSDMIRLLWECGLTMTLNVQISACISAQNGY